MKRKIKRKLKIKRIIILICILSILTFTSYKLLTKEEPTKENKKETEKTNGTVKEESKPVLDYTNYITETSETNGNIIKKYLTEGISVDKFKNSLSKISNYVDKSGSYTQIEYNFEKHYKYEELESIYLNLNKSEIVKLENIGVSYDGRNIYSIEIGKGTNTVMLEGNIHAAEIGPALFLTKFAVNLVNRYENGDAETIELLNNHKILIVPSINPDGYDFSIFGKEILNDKNSYAYLNDDKIDNYYYKANANGVDLNRNMPSQNGGLYFESLSSTYTSEKSPYKREYFPGYSLGSEPETQALMYWMYKNYKTTYAYLSIHSAGRVIYNGKPLLSDTFNSLTKECANIINKHTKYTKYGLSYEDDGYGNDGTSTDMISEIAHGFKFSTITGRLTTSAYNTQHNTIEQELCVLTVETLTNYTQNLETIKNEYENRNLEEAFIDIIKMK